MTIDQIISPDIPTLAPEDTGNYALELMDLHKCLQLPIVADDQYLGLAQEKVLLDAADTAQPLGNQIPHLFKPCIVAASHPFDAIRMCLELNLSVLPVVDNEQKYIGAVTHLGLLKFVAENGSLTLPGGVLVLEVAPRNYSLYEIARICENEDANILNTQVRTNERGLMEVTLKLNRNVLDGIVAALRRHNYIVTEVYGDNSSNEDIAGKYRLLMTYINM